MAEKLHSALGASSMYRWSACPASVRLCKDLPDTPSPFAIEGTRAHALLEHCLKNGELDTVGYIGTKLPGEDWTVETDHARGVQVALDYIWSVYTKGAKMFVETEVRLDYIRLGMFGTCDCLIFDYATGTLFVPDYKNGAMFVDVVGNMQARYYGLGAMRWLADNEPDAYAKLSTVVLTIIQPNAIGAEPVRSEILDAVDLKVWEVELRAAVERTEDPNAKFSPGDHCKFCRGAAHCEALRTIAVQAHKTAFSKVSGGTLEQNLSVMSAEEIGARMSEAEQISIYLEAVIELGKSQAKAGKLPVGYKWVRGRGSREWVGPAPNILSGIKIATGVDLSEVICPSVAQAETKLGKEVYRKIEYLVNKKEGAPTLAKVSDKRAAIDPTEVTKTAFSPVKV